MTRALLLGVLVATAGCGPAPAPGPGFDFELVVQRGLLDTISAFQVALVTRGTSLDCLSVQTKCIKDQVDASRFVKVKDASGRQASALVFPISLTTGQAGAPNTQDVSLHDVPIGNDFVVVVEAISKETTPRLAGSSCNYVKEIVSGANQTVFAKIETIAPPANCDPRLAP